jgi:hypothetical protein
MRYQLDKQGREIPDPDPISIPLGFKKPETLAEAVRRLVRSDDWAKKMADDGQETFEEADDFEVGDDFDPSSPFEQVFDPILNKDVSHQEYVDNAAHYKRQYEAQFSEENPPAASTEAAEPPAAAPEQK